MQLFEIGSKVEFVRRHAVEGVITGTGLLRAYGVDAENRVIALIQDSVRVGQDGQPEVFNTPVMCVNPTNEMIEDFKNLVVQVSQIEEKANAEIKKLTDAANAEIVALNDNLFGEPISFETETETLAEETEEDNLVQFPDPEVKTVTAEK